MNALEEELKTYAQHEEELKKSATGKFAVIKGTEIVGVFDDLEAALTEATRLLGQEEYLIVRIGEPVQTITIPALTL
jgi:hypothetical protein